jgi:hypothetical protein
MVWHGNDPWAEAARLAGLPSSEAVERLAQIISGMPTSIWPLQAAEAIAARLIVLLPLRSGNPGQNRSASVYRSKSAGSLIVVMVSLALAAAVLTGVFPIADQPAPEPSSTAGVATPS